MLSYLDVWSPIKPDLSNLYKSDFVITSIEVPITNFQYSYFTFAKMANKFTPISAISGGKKDLKLIVRVAHIWLIRDKENPDDIIFMNMMLVDDKVC